MIGDKLQARVCGVGLVAPGIPDWQRGAPVLARRHPWRPGPLVIPATEFLPPAERRRAGKAIRLALGCGYQAVQSSGRPADGMASVFASTDGDAENTHQICMALDQAEPSVSPTRFHNSVQNAVSGYWTILTGSRAPTTMVMGGDEILAIGLLEAMTQAVEAEWPVLLVVFDVPMPAPLFAAHPIDEGGAIALLLDARATKGPTMSLSLQSKTTAEVREVPGDDLTGLRKVHPVGSALPMLQALAGGGSGDRRTPVALDFDRYHVLQVALQP